MLHADDYLKLAASNFKIAEERFKDAEDALRTLQIELANCAERLAKIQHIELPFWEQLDALVHDSQPVDTKELHLVSR